MPHAAVRLTNEHVGQRRVCGLTLGHARGLINRRAYQGVPKPESRSLNLHEPGRDGRRDCIYGHRSAADNRGSRQQLPEG